MSKLRERERDGHTCRQTDRQRACEIDIPAQTAVRNRLKDYGSDWTPQRQIAASPMYKYHNAERPV